MFYNRMLKAWPPKKCTFRTNVLLKSMTNAKINKAFKKQDVAFKQTARGL